MLSDFISVYMYITSAVLGGVVWAVRQEGRITGVSNSILNLEKISDQRADDAKELVNVKLEAIDKRLERIERLILNGSSHG